MAYSKADLRSISDRTTGKCHICHKQLALTNYGLHGRKGCWEVEHSVAKANGGTDHANNLYAACIACNRKKQAGSTRAARARNGNTRAPLSRRKRKEAKANAVAGGAALGALVGTLFGVPGILLGTTLGAIVGSQQKPE